jgi:hypothetical protein
MNQPGATPKRAGIGRVALALITVVVAVAAAGLFAINPQRPVAPNHPRGPDGVVAIQRPPSDRPLLWFRENNSSSPFILRAIDWNGRTVGRLSVSCADCGVLASPDGQRLLIGDQSLPGPVRNLDHVYDSSGDLLGAVDGFQAQWANDSRHLCMLRPSPLGAAGSGAIGATVLEIDAQSGSRRVLAAVTTLPNRHLSGAWMLISCSPGTDRAVVVFADRGVGALRVIKLSNGTTVTARDDATGPEGCGCPIESLAISGDGRVAVENLVGPEGPRGGPAGPRVLNLVTGQESEPGAAWAGHVPIAGLSWSGRIAVTPVGAFTFPDSRQLWNAPLPAYVLPTAADPRSDDVLLTFWVSSAQTGQPVIVRSGGSAVKLSPSFLSQPPLPY